MKHFHSVQARIRKNKYASSLELLIKNLQVLIINLLRAFQYLISATVLHTCNIYFTVIIHYYY